MNHCKNCHKETHNPSFCSQPCAASYNNKISPKRSPEGHCVVCKSKCKTSTKYCSPSCKESAILSKKRTKKEILKSKSKAVTDWRRRKKLKAIAYKGGKCIRCGYDKYHQAMQFHHTNPNKKDFNISSGNTRSWERTKIELDQCDLVCCRCHIEIHMEIKLATGMGVEPT